MYNNVQNWDRLFGFKGKGAQCVHFIIEINKQMKHFDLLITLFNILLNYDEFELFLNVLFKTILKHANSKGNYVLVSQRN